MLRRSAMPRRRKREPMGVRVSSVIRCHAHLAWVRRAWQCTIKDQHDCQGVIEAAHVRAGTDGGTGMKPGVAGHIRLAGRPTANNTPLASTPSSGSTGSISSKSPLIYGRSARPANGIGRRRKCDDPRRHLRDGLGVSDG